MGPVDWSVSLAASTENAPIDPSEGYEGFIGWVLGLMTDLGEVGVGLALLIETFFPRCPVRRCSPAPASWPTTAT